MLDSKSQPHLAFKDSAIIIYSIYIPEDGGGCTIRSHLKITFEWSKTSSLTFSSSRKKVAAAAGVQQTNP